MSWWLLWYGNAVPLIDSLSSPCIFCDITAAINRESTVYNHMYQSCTAGPGQTYDRFSARKLLLKDRGKIDRYLKHELCANYLDYQAVLHVFWIKKWRYSDKKMVILMLYNSWLWYSLPLKKALKLQLVPIYIKDLWCITYDSGSIY